RVHASLLSPSLPISFYRPPPPPPPYPLSLHDALPISIERNPAFPNRTNVSWYAELEPGSQARIRARIFERGVGETLSSGTGASRSEEHTSELQSRFDLVCRLLLEKKKKIIQ